MKTPKHHFGKLPPKKDTRTLLFSSYFLPAQMPPLPQQVSWQNALPANCGWMGNDTLNDCTCASAGHLVMSWTGNASGNCKILSDQDIIACFSALTGYDPASGANNTGVYCLDMLKYWQQTGVGGDLIDSYVQLDNGRFQQIQAAIYLFGGAIAGFALPGFVDVEPVPAIWDVPAGGATGINAPNSNNGHAVPLVGYDSNYIYFVTWGELKRMTWNFYSAYSDEAWVALSSSDWLNNGQNPAGFDLPALQADLGEINNA